MTNILSVIVGPLLLFLSGSLLAQESSRDIRDNTFRPKSNYVYWVCPGANARE